MSLVQRVNRDRGRFDDEQPLISTLGMLGHVVLHGHQLAVGNSQLCPPRGTEEDAGFDGPPGPGFAGGCDPDVLRTDERPVLPVRRGTDHRDGPSPDPRHAVPYGCRQQVGRPDEGGHFRCGRGQIELVDTWFGDFVESRARLAAVRERLWHASLDNVAGISHSLTGDGGDAGDFLPATPFERELAMNTYDSSALHDAEAERSATLRSELKVTRTRLARTERALKGGNRPAPAAGSTSLTATFVSGQDDSCGDHQAELDDLRVGILKE